MNSVATSPVETPATAAPEKSVARPDTPHRARLSAWQGTLAISFTALLALALHHFLAKAEPAIETRTYSLFLAGIAGAGVLLAGLQSQFRGLRSWLHENWPLLCATIVLLGALEVITTGFRLLPLPYFPSPARILQSVVDDRAVLWNSTWHSFLLLSSGYAVGVLAGLISGVCIGWFAPARYWGMPLLKIIGPIPATAWVPLALVLAPSAMFSAVSLIALAVWFPVTMLTASGISNTPASYLDVARTLGASRSFLIFRVAIPAAMPNVFLGLFMGLGSACLTLIVAETVGVKSGLGWYLSWAREWAEYGKLYSALVIMSLFFSAVMTALFKLRDRVLVWQKGTIKW